MNNEMKVALRTASKSDFEEVLSMMKDFNAIDHYPFDRELRHRNLIEFTQNENLGRLWVITWNGSSIGYIVLAFGFSFEYGGRDAFIDEFFIKKDYRNKGIGKGTLQYISKAAIDLKINAIHLEVEKHNTGANELYTKSDYRGKERVSLTKETHSS